MQEPTHMRLAGSEIQTLNHLTMTQVCKIWAKSGTHRSDPIHRAPIGLFSVILQPCLRAWRVIWFLLDFHFRFRVLGPRWIGSTFADGPKALRCLRVAYGFRRSPDLAVPPRFSIFRLRRLSHGSLPLTDWKIDFILCWNKVKKNKKLKPSKQWGVLFLHVFLVLRKCKKGTFTDFRKKTKILDFICNTWVNHFLR